MWQKGDWIDDRWEVHNIFSGGMGIVYIVYDREFKEFLAAKTYQDELVKTNSTIAEGFKREAEAWIALDVHPNVTHARFVTLIEGKHYIFMEYVGYALNNWIGTPALTQDLPQVIKFSINICDGMIHAQSKGIIAHRDLKPANCLISPNGTLKITDFGLAKILMNKVSTSSDQQILNYENSSVKDSENESGIARISFTFGNSQLSSVRKSFSQTGKARGTLAYMAPEQFADSKRVDIRADIYSVGIILFEMITGKLPFNANNPVDYSNLHKHQPAPTLPNSPNVTLTQIIRACLEKDPDKRFVSFEELREQLSIVYKELTGKDVAEPAKGKELDASQYSNKAVSLFELDHAKVDIGIEYIQKAIDIDPLYDIAWYNKAIFHLDKDQTKEALECLDRTIELNPSHKLAYFEKGNLILELKYPLEEVVICYTNAINIDNSFKEALSNRGFILCKLGHFKEAIDDLKKAKKLGSKQAKTNLSFCLRKQQEEIPKLKRKHKSGQRKK